MILDYDYLICCIVHVDYLTTALDPGPLLCVLQILHLSCKINKHNQSTEVLRCACLPFVTNCILFMQFHGVIMYKFKDHSMFHEAKFKLRVPCQIKTLLSSLS